ncbi:DUF2249 domain-containing protein [Salibacterium aidingense]|uniref:DUF2249 domain-containing protein n=1 Tax=Salibacterium aidingense TaxID=384933 RepID=UPI00041AF981|nr:DUF2249 domain-containing protein [Salibacterium aidingense]
MEKRQADTHVVELDVRNMLRNNQEPFHIITKTVRSLRSEERLVLHATFRPAPLLTFMKKKGFENEVEQVEEDHWKVTFYRDGGMAIETE